jgi:hypothetical protein
MAAFRATLPALFAGQPTIVRFEVSAAAPMG